MKRKVELTFEQVESLIMRGETVTIVPAQPGVRIKLYREKDGSLWVTDEQSDVENATPSQPRST